MTHAPQGAHRDGEASAPSSRTGGEVRLPDGTVTADARGLFTRPPPEVAAAWAAERVYWKADPE